MPILRPEVSRLMESAGLNSRKNKDIKESLEDAGLGITETLEKMKDLRDYSDSESTKLRVNEAILKMHGVMKDEGSSIPNITIVINDKDNLGINPILLPRELHKLKASESVQ
jgi:hypothetical protein